MVKFKKQQVASGPAMAPARGRSLRDLTEAAGIADLAFLSEIEQAAPIPTQNKPKEGMACVRVFMPDNSYASFVVADDATAGDVAGKAFRKFCTMTGGDESVEHVLYMVTFDKEDRPLYDEERLVQLRQKFLSSKAAHAAGDGDDIVRFQLRPKAKEEVIAMYFPDESYGSFRVTAETTAAELAEMGRRKYNRIMEYPDQDQSAALAIRVHTFNKNDKYLEPDDKPLLIKMNLVVANGFVDGHAVRFELLERDSTTDKRASSVLPASTATEAAPAKEATPEDRAMFEIAVRALMCTPASAVRSMRSTDAASEDSSAQKRKSRVGRKVSVDKLRALSLRCAGRVNDLQDKHSKAPADDGEAERERVYVAALSHYHAHFLCQRARHLILISDTTTDDFAAIFGTTLRNEIRRFDADLVDRRAAETRNAQQRRTGAAGATPAPRPLPNMLGPDKDKYEAWMADFTSMLLDVVGSGADDTKTVVRKRRATEVSADDTVATPSGTLRLSTLSRTQAEALGLLRAALSIPQADADAIVERERVAFEANPSDLVLGLSQRLARAAAHPFYNETSLDKARAAAWREAEGSQTRELMKAIWSAPRQSNRECLFKCRLKISLLELVGVRGGGVDCTRPMALALLGKKQHMTLPIDYSDKAGAAPIVWPDATFEFDVSNPAAIIAIEVWDESKSQKIAVLEATAVSYMEGLLNSPRGPSPDPIRRRRRMTSVVAPDTAPEALFQVSCVVDASVRAMGHVHVRGGDYSSWTDIFMAVHVLDGDSTGTVFKMFALPRLFDGDEEEDGALPSSTHKRTPSSLSVSSRKRNTSGGESDSRMRSVSGASTSSASELSHSGSSLSLPSVASTAGAAGSTGTGGGVLQREGMLTCKKKSESKRSSLNLSRAKWKPMYFLLRNTRLFIYKEKPVGDVSPVADYDVVHATIEAVAEHKKRPNVITLTLSDGVVYFMQAASSPEMDAWAETLRKAAAMGAPIPAVSLTSSGSVRGPSSRWKSTASAAVAANAFAAAAATSTRRGAAPTESAIPEEGGLAASSSGPLRKPADDGAGDAHARGDDDGTRPREVRMGMFHLIGEELEEPLGGDVLPDLSFDIVTDAGTRLSFLLPTTADWKGWHGALRALTRRRRQTDAVMVSRADAEGNLAMRQRVRDAYAAQGTAVPEVVNLDVDRAQRVLALAQSGAPPALSTPLELSLAEAIDEDHHGQFRMLLYALLEHDSETEELSEAAALVMDTYGTFYGVAETYRRLLYVDALARQYNLECHRKSARNVRYLPVLAELLVQFGHSIETSRVGLSLLEKAIYDDVLSLLETLQTEQISAYKDWFPYAKGGIEATLRLLNVVVQSEYYRAKTKRAPNPMADLLLVCIGRATVARYDRVGSMTADLVAAVLSAQAQTPTQHADARSPLQLMKMAQLVGEELAEDAEYFRMAFAPYTDVVATAGGEYARLLLKDVRRCVASPVHTDSEKIDLYLRVRRLVDGPLREARTPKSEADVDGLVAAFEPCIRGWLTSTGKQLREWTRRALRDDTFTLVESGGGTLHSASVVDVFCCFNQSFDFVQRLNWPNASERHQFLEMFSESTCRTLEEYVVGLKDACAERFFEKGPPPPPNANPNTAMGQLSALLESKIDLVEARVNSVFGAPERPKPRPMTVEDLFTALNNIEVARQQLAELKRLFLAHAAALPVENGFTGRHFDEAVSVLDHIALAGILADLAEEMAGSIQSGLLHLTGVDVSGRAGSASRELTEADLGATDAEVQELVDPVIAYMNEKLELFTEHLYDPVFQRVLERMWVLVLETIEAILCPISDAAGAQNGAQAPRQPSRHVDLSGSMRRRLPSGVKKALGGVLTPRQHAMFDKAINIFRGFLHADSDGLPLDVLDSPKLAETRRLLAHCRTPTKALVEAHDAQATPEAERTLIRLVISNRQRDSDAVQWMRGRSNSAGSGENAVDRIGRSITSWFK